MLCRRHRVSGRLDGRRWNRCAESAHRDVFQFMPGWKLESTGEVRICRGEALVGWRSVGLEGAMLEGFNHVSAARDGTLRRITGFQAG